MKVGEKQRTLHSAEEGASAPVTVLQALVACPACGIPYDQVAADEAVRCASCGHRIVLVLRLVH